MAVVQYFEGPLLECPGCNFSLLALHMGFQALYQTSNQIVNAGCDVTCENCGSYLSISYEFSADACHQVTLLEKGEERHGKSCNL